MGAKQIVEAIEKAGNGYEAGPLYVKKGGHFCRIGQDAEVANYVRKFVDSQETRYSNSTGERLSEIREATPSTSAC